MQTPGAFELSVLLAVLRLGDDAYGVTIRDAVVAFHKRDCAIGAIYTTLQRIERKGLVKSRMTEPSPVRGGRSRRTYRLTAAGHRAIAAAREQAAQLWGPLPVYSQS